MDYEPSYVFLSLLLSVKISMMAIQLRSDFTIELEAKQFPAEKSLFK